MVKVDVSMCPPGVISPIPVQGNVDDVLMVSREECVVMNMLARTDAFLEWSGLEIKDTKCAVLYERRSGGNRWCRSKSDKCPVFTVTTKSIQVYSLHETYAYLGHKINIAGEWKEQVNIILSEFTSKLDLIDKCPLPLTMKLEAIRQVTLYKVQHLFSNVHIQQKVLSEMDNKTVSLVQKWFGLNTHSTRDVIFHPQREGGLGVPNVIWIYTSIRISHLLNMLNNDDKDIRELARSSLFLDLRRRKVLLGRVRESEPQFLGFKRKPSGILDTHSAGFGVWSDWPDLNDLCVRTGVSLEWVRSDSESVRVSEDIITDTLTYVTATATYGGEHLQEPGEHSSIYINTNTNNTGLD